jgi:hypothetical protein
MIGFGRVSNVKALSGAETSLLPLFAAIQAATVNVVRPRGLP